jgi:putative cell wall-binding protein
MPTLRHRMLAVSLATLAVVVSLVSLPAGSAVAAPAVTVQRIFGSDRYGTSAAVALATFPAGGTQFVLPIVATGTDFPDAAVGTGMPSGYFPPGPVLLTRPQALPQPIQDALITLGRPGGHIVGGKAAVSVAAQLQLRALGGDWRIQGRDRYETAVQVARVTFDPEANRLGTVDGKPSVFLVGGLSAMDALAVAPLAYAQKVPVLLTRPDVLSSAVGEWLGSVRQLLGSGGIQVFVIGGPSSVSPAVLAELQAMGNSTQRIAGLDVASTAVAVADFALQKLGWEPTHLNLVRGDSFADAASAAARAGQLRAPLLFTTSPIELGSATADFLRAHAGTIDSIDVIGGPSAISDAVVAQARSAATG